MGVLVVVGEKFAGEGWCNDLTFYGVGVSAA